MKNLRTRVHERVVSRYSRDCETLGHVCQQPGDVDVDGTLITLSNARGVLARYAYRVDRTGRVRFTEVP